MSILTREQILTAHDLKEEEVFVEEWAGAVKVRSLTLGQFIGIQSDAKRDGVVDELRLTAITFIEGVCEPKFDKSAYMDLSRKSLGAIQRVTRRILDLSAIGPAAVEEAAKNSETTESVDSNTN